MVEWMLMLRPHGKLPLEESGRAAAKAFSSALSPLGRAVKVVEQQCLMLQCMSPVLAQG
jgi:hypothetical protein